MKISITKANELGYKKAEKLFELYVHELGEIAGIKFDPAKDTSLYDRLFKAYWENDDHFPFLIFYGKELAGFSLVRKYPSDKNVYDMGHFYILEKFRKKGVGRKAFCLSLNAFPGKWLVRVLLENRSALQFWEKAINGKTNGNYLVSKELDEGLRMHFIRYTI